MTWQTIETAPKDDKEEVKPLSKLELPPLIERLVSNTDFKLDAAQRQRAITLANELSNSSDIDLAASELIYLRDAVSARQARIAALEAQLAAINSQAPAWYVVESENSDDDMLFRDPEIAQIYASGLADHVEGEIIVSKLYTQPLQLQIPEDFVLVPEGLEHELQGILADLPIRGFDEVCLSTLKRVNDILACGIRKVNHAI